jgi:lysozyme family protein
MIDLKSEIQMKDIQKEEIQLSLDKTQSELDKLNGYKYLKKHADTSYMSTYINDYEKEKKFTDPSYTSAFNDYDNLMNRVDDEINELFKTTTKYDEEPCQLKQFNEKEDYTHENRAIHPFTKEREE